MKLQIIYTSLTGCTQKVAESLYHGIDAQEKSIHNLKDGIPVLDGDVILFGYWATNGKPCREMIDLLQSVHGKTVGVFCTLGYYSDSIHAFDTMKSGINILKDGNQIIGGYVCTGAVSAKLIAGQGLDKPHIPTTQKEIRWEIGKNHPTKAECDLAVERFNERIYLYNRCKELNIPFQSVL